MKIIVNPSELHKIIVLHIDIELRAGKVDMNNVTVGQIDVFDDGIVNVIYFNTAFFALTF